MSKRSAFWVFFAFALVFAYFWPPFHSSGDSAPALAGIQSPALLAVSVNLPIERWDAH